MSLLLVGILLLGVASAQDDGVKVSVKPAGPVPGVVIGPGPCGPGRVPVACTTGIPPSCSCGIAPPQKPLPIPLPTPIDPVPIDPIPLPFPRPCACFALYDPVCGADGKTYGNSCEAGCNKVKVDCQGRCPCPKPPPPSGCQCFAIFAPVCGRDGVTYSNSCEAKCAGTSEQCKGGCPCKKPAPPPDCIFANGRFQGDCAPKPSPPSTPSDINKFLDECVKKGESASVAAARAACSTLKNKCPAVSPRLALSGDAAAASKASFNPADALLEKVLEGACLLEAENACKSKAFDNLADSTCKRLLNNGPASPGAPGCKSLKDAVNIFNGEVNRLCKKD